MSRELVQPSAVVHRKRLRRAHAWQLPAWATQCLVAGHAFAVASYPRRPFTMRSTLGRELRIVREELRCDTCDRLEKRKAVGMIDAGLLPGERRVRRRCRRCAAMGLARTSDGMTWCMSCDYPQPRGGY